MKVILKYPDMNVSFDSKTLNDVYARLRNNYSSDIESGQIDSIEILINPKIKKEKISLG